MVKTVVSSELEFLYLKWILNNFNHIQKLKLCLDIDTISCIDYKLNRSIIDANFIYRYCMPDTIINLIHLDFHIITEYKLKMNDIEKVIHSFKIHPVFIEHQWTNVKCFPDSALSCQHISSSNTYMPLFFSLLNVRKYV